MDPNSIVPVTLFLVVGATVSLMAYLTWRVRHAAQETLRAAITAGQQLDENTVRALAARPNQTPESDLRAGVQGVAAGIGFIVSAVFCHFISFDNGLTNVLGVVGIVVTFIGVGNMVSWNVRSKLPKSEA